MYNIHYYIIQFSIKNNLKTDDLVYFFIIIKSILDNEIHTI